MGQRRNLKINYIMPQEKWKWEHNILKLVDTGKAILREKFMGINAYFKKQENCK